MSNISNVRQGWLVTHRELRERIRSKGFWVGSALMLFVVIAVIVVPAMLEGGSVSRDVGFTGIVPEGLTGAATAQGEAIDMTVRVHRFEDVAAGEQAVRDEDVDVLVVDARLLKWRGEPDEQLRSLLTAAITRVTLEDRAAAAGISQDELAALAAPVPIDDEELAIAAGRSRDDETAAYVMSILLLSALAMYGQLVLTGVVQEKSSRVVEVLLARVPASTLLAGKVAGIGLLGLAQFAVTALAALAATSVVDAVDIPAVSGEVLAWVVAWFVLGYVVYAMAYGAFGSLASRVEDASSLAAPATTVLIVGYWASLIAIGNDPDGGWAQLVSLVPATAPFAMPARVALGAAAWWEPVLAAALAVAAIGGLVVVAGRVYTGAILHGGGTLKLRDAWRRGAAAPGREPDAVDGSQSAERKTADRHTNLVLIGLAAVVGALVFVLTRDVIWAIAGGFASYAVASRTARAAWTNGPRSGRIGRAPWRQEGKE
jgi:ABC-2 type transport system permease protein